MFLVHSIQLDHLRAKKVKNSLCQFLYEHVFRNVIHLINKSQDKNMFGDDLENSTLSHISLLDIAGFGNFATFFTAEIACEYLIILFYAFHLLESFNRNNHFEQLCINFINEKIQQMFVKIMIKNEEQWYASENLEIPKIQFLDNDPVLGK